MGTKWSWTEERLSLLREHYPYDTWEDLLKLFPFSSKWGIISEASKQKISRERYNKCHRSDEEVQFILDNIESMSVDEIAKTLNRNFAFVYNVLNQHEKELPGHKGGHLKPEDEALFKEIYPQYTNRYLSEKYFTYLTPHQMRTQAKKFGLVKTQEKGVKWYDKEDLLDKLEHVIREMGRVPMLQELQAYGLPSETTFRRYFGGVTKACTLIGIERPNYRTSVYNHDQQFLYDEAGNFCLSNYEIQISNFLIHQNIDFKKEVRYDTVIPKEEAGAKRFDWQVGDCFIEFFGLMRLEKYNQGAQNKIELCKKHKIKLLGLFPQDFNKSRTWQQKILNFLDL